MPHWTQMSGFWVSLFQNTALSMQAFRQAPHPMHFSAFRRTPPSGRISSASTGQARAHGGFLQERQTMTVNPFDIPPADLTPMQEFDSPATPLRREQANMHNWQPTQRCASITFSFIGMFPS